MERGSISVNIVDKKESFLFLIAAAVTPAIFNYYYYCRNAIHGVTFYHSTVFSLICAAINIALFFVVSKIVSKPASLLSTLLLWLAFWGVVPISAMLSSYMNRIQTGLGVVIVIAGVTVVFRFVKFNVLVGNVIAVMVCALFIYNFTHGCVIALAKAPVSSAYQSSLTKSNFIVDDIPSRPDIIWIHADGMISFSTVEKFFGDRQNELKAYLDENGFLVNEDARLNAGFTSVAVPSLISPFLYDTYLGDVLSDISNIAYYDARASLTDKRFNKDGFTLRSVWNREEIFLAFMQAGYRANGGFLPAYGYYPIDLYYANDSNGFIYLMQKNDALGDIDFEKKLSYCTYVESLANFTAMQIFRGYIRPYVDKIRNNMDSIVYKVNDSAVHEDDATMEMLKDLLHQPSPQISYIYTYITHPPFNRDEDGNLLSPVPMNDRAPENYMPQYTYAGKYLMKMVDLIMSENPETIIVIQADHGMSLQKNSKYSLEDYSEEQALELLTSVFSAVRIPSQYGALSEPLDPLDISRWLVNHFVGEGNYDYLYYQEVD